MIVDALWEQKVRENLSKIKKLQKKTKELGINDLVYSKKDNIIFNPKWGPWKKKYHETLKEFKWWQEMSQKKPLRHSYSWWNWF